MNQVYNDITTKELHDRDLEDKKLLIIDLRDRPKYVQRHIKGAVSFPMKPSLWDKLLKKRALRTLLGSDLCRPVAFY
ncbi:rhodanese-like domain-containing protein [Desulfogranum marinum]|jgi:rhodanese-related sulfurtransferase|uniref:rhodanese-like domain-containing protein n=1 Tax=Desulfogranum marinum TaxID=453220 RepID=UPI00196403AF|nr:rhodanese-like domain-containing protein [Desulfogranum marinum]MBM9514330.1 rhodanese-like domain-containing protein [Desulfogranum marinum]